MIIPYYTQEEHLLPPAWIQVALEGTTTLIKHLFQPWRPDATEQLKPIYLHHSLGNCGGQSPGAEPEPQWAAASPCTQQFPAVRGAVLNTALLNPSVSSDRLLPDAFNLGW